MMGWFVLDAPGRVVAALGRGPPPVEPAKRQQLVTAGRRPTRERCEGRLWPLSGPSRRTAAPDSLRPRGAVDKRQLSGKLQGTVGQSTKLIELIGLHAAAPPSRRAWESISRWSPSPPNRMLMRVAGPDDNVKSCFRLRARRCETRRSRAGTTIPVRLRSRPARRAGGARSRRRASTRRRANRGCKHHAGGGQAVWP